MNVEQNIPVRSYSRSWLWPLACTRSDIHRPATMEVNTINGCTKTKLLQWSSLLVSLRVPCQSHGPQATPRIGVSGSQGGTVGRGLVSQSSVSHKLNTSGSQQQKIQKLLCSNPRLGYFINYVNSFPFSPSKLTMHLHQTFTNRDRIICRPKIPCHLKFKR